MSHVTKRWSLLLGGYPVSFKITHTNTITNNIITMSTNSTNPNATTKYILFYYHHNYQPYYQLHHTFSNTPGPQVLGVFTSGHFLMKSPRKKVDVKKLTFFKKKIWVIIALLVIWTTFSNQFVILRLFFNYLVLALERKIAKNRWWWLVFCLHSPPPE